MQEDARDEWSGAAPSQEEPRIDGKALELGKGREGFSPVGFKGTSCQYLDLGTFSLQNC